MNCRTLLLTLFCFKNITAEINFDGATADSTYESNNDMTFNATNALTYGLDFWSSSENARVSSWRAWFNIPVTLIGVKISWMYAPKKYKIMYSFDRKTDATLVDWSEDAKDSDSRVDELTFSQPIAISEIKIIMDGSFKKYHGIRQVLPIINPGTSFILINGLTNEKDEELCLQTLKGSLEYGNKVLLMSCAYAIANNDGRELLSLTLEQKLRFDKSDNACIAYDSILKSFYLENCESYNAARFKYNGNAQLMLESHSTGADCVIADSDSELFEDMLSLNSDSCKINITSVANENHPAIALIDKNTKTYWASKGFPDYSDHAVAIDFVFNSEVTFNKIMIDWEYPALNYNILTSENGNDFNLLENVFLNGLNSTLTDLGEVKTKFFRLMLLQPHPVLGKFEKTFLYGIRNVRFIFNSVNLLLKSCADAAGSLKAGDKWFRHYVRLADISAISRSSEARDLFSSSVRSMLHSVARINTLDVAGCSEMALSMKQEFDEIKVTLREAMHEKPNIIFQRDRDGLTMQTAAYQCIKENNGYFYLNVPCSPAKVLRVLCFKGIAYKLEKYKEGNEFEDAILSSCALNGLVPAEIISASLIDELITFQTANALNSSALLLGIDYECIQTKRCNKDFFDIPLRNHLQRFLYKYISQYSNAEAVVGVRDNNFVIESLEQIVRDAVIPCQIPESIQIGHVVALSCDTTGSSPILSNVSRFTLLKAICPDNCSNQAIYGNSIYSSRSNICTAMRHFGIDVSDYKIFGIAKASALKFYKSEEKNSILSHFENGISDYSFSFDIIIPECPIINQLVFGSIASKKNTVEQPSQVSNLVFSASIKGLADKASVLFNLNQYVLKKFTAEALNHISASNFLLILDFQKKLFHLDRSSINAGRLHATSELSKKRSELKPVEVEFASRLRPIEYLEQIKDYSAFVYQKLSKIITLIDALNNEKKILEIKKNFFSSQPFSLDAQQTNKSFRIDSAKSSIVFSSDKHQVLSPIYSARMLSDISHEIQLLSEKNLYDFLLEINISFGNDADAIGVLYRYNVVFQHGYMLQVMTEKAALNTGLLDGNASSNKLFDNLDIKDKNKLSLVYVRLSSIKAGRVYFLKPVTSFFRVLNYNNIALSLKVARGHHSVYFNDDLILSASCEMFAMGKLALMMLSFDPSYAVSVTDIKVESLCPEKTDAKIVDLIPLQCNFFNVEVPQLNMLQEKETTCLSVTLDTKNSYRLRTISHKGERHNCMHYRDLSINQGTKCLEGTLQFKYKAYSSDDHSAAVGVTLEDTVSSRLVRVLLTIDGLYIIFNTNEKRLVTSAVTLQLNSSEWSNFTITFSLAKHEISFNNMRTIKIGPLAGSMQEIYITVSNIDDLYISKLKLLPKSFEHMLETF